MDFSVQEKQFVIKFLVIQAIPSPKLLIKDNNTINERGGFPTRLEILATKFTATFSNIGYLGTKEILDKAKVNYSQVSIFQASDLKERPEELDINRYGVIIASVYAVNMYPYIKIVTIRKSVICFARKLTQQPKRLSTFACSSSTLG